MAAVVHPRPLWTPTAAQIECSHLARFAREHGFDPQHYEALHRWSVSDLDGFWNALWDFSGVIGERGATTLLRRVEGAKHAQGNDATDGCAMFGARWYPQARLNFAENLLCGDDTRLAVIEDSEQEDLRRVTMGELRAEVSRLQQGLRALGVKPGDVVAGIVPNRLDALVALLAAASIGAVWASCSPDFGAPGIIDRIGQVQPKLLFAVDSYVYNGKRFDIADNLARILPALEGLEHVVMGAERAGAAGHIRAPAGVAVHAWADVTASAAARLQFERLPFAHPLYILFTSGTTGLPKGIVHSAGGVLLQHRKEHLLHCDVQPGEVMSWYTNTAWMMYHWLVSGLASGAAIVLYDGAAMPTRQEARQTARQETDPNGPDHGVLWQLAEASGITHFGTSPKYLASLQQAGYAPGQHHDLSALRSVLSAGAPVQPEQFDWLYQAIKPDMLFASVSGGTEIIGCFALGSPVHPVWRGELTCKALGHAVEVFDERGAPCIGRKGQLVCTEPFPSAPLSFWGENGQARYHAAYFAEYPDIWTHGDLAEQTLRGSLIIYGRSDNTLKPGGVRIGTAEIYRVVDRLPEVRDAVVFGIPEDGDEAIVLCVVLQDKFGQASQPLDAALLERLRAEIRHQASPRHVPRYLFAVSAIPYTLNGKRVEDAARAAALGLPVKNQGSLINPEALDEYARLLLQRQA